MKTTKPILLSLLLISILSATAIGYLTINKPSITVRIIPRGAELAVEPDIFSVGDLYRLEKKELHFTITNVGEATIQLHAMLQNLIVDGKAGTAKYGNSTSIFPYSDHLYFYETSPTLDSNGELDTAFRTWEESNQWYGIGYKHLLEPYNSGWTDKLPILSEAQSIKCEINLEVLEYAEFGSWSWNYVIEGI